MMIKILLSAAFLLIAQSAWAQNVETTIPLPEILQRAESVSVRQDSLMAHGKYKMRENVIFNELNDQGGIKNADTTISDITIADKKEIARDIVYSSRKEKSSGKKNQDQGVGFSFSFTDPEYNFSLTGTSDSSYIIAVSPKGSPKKGDYRGTVEIDRRGFFLRTIDLDVPKPEGALKEFTTRMSFEPLEGGLVVIREMKMKGLAKAFLGIFKVRFSGDVTYSNYEILK